MNIDKDIEIVKEFTESDFCLYGQEEIIEATKNVLSDRENWKKIAEFLASRLIYLPLGEDLKQFFTKEAVMDWARKEVENES